MTSMRADEQHDEDDGGLEGGVVGGEVAKRLLVYMKLFGVSCHNYWCVRGPTDSVRLSTFDVDLLLLDTYLTAFA